MCANARLNENGSAAAKILQSFCKIDALHKLQGLRLSCSRGTSCRQIETGLEANNSNFLRT